MLYTTTFVSIAFIIPESLLMPTSLLPLRLPYCVAQDYWTLPSSPHIEGVWLLLSTMMPLWLLEIALIDI